jgi:hypothetical protein
MRAMLHNFKRITTASRLYHEIRWNLGNAATLPDMAADHRHSNGGVRDE